MKNFDDLFREASENYSETPPAAVWTALEKRLDNKKRRIFPLRWFWYFSVVSFLTLLGASIAWKTTLTAPTGDMASLKTTEKEPAINNNVTATNTTSTDNTATTNNTITNHKETTHEKTKHNTANDTHMAPAATVSSAENTTAKIHKRKKKALKTHNATTATPENRITETGTANAPTVGTSAYSYDDFEENTAVQTALEPAASAANNGMPAGYVARKTTGNRIVAVEMEPATPEQHSSTAQRQENNSNDGNVAATSAKEQLGDSEKINSDQQNRRVEKPAIAHTSATRKSVSRSIASAKKNTNSVGILSAVPVVTTTSPSASKVAAKTPTVKSAAYVVTTAANKKEVNQPTAVTTNNSSKKEVRHSAAITSKTESVATTTAAKTPVKVEKTAITQPTAKNVQIATRHAVATTLPARKNTATANIPPAAASINATNSTEKKVASTEHVATPAKTPVAATASIKATNTSKTVIASTAKTKITKQKTVPSATIPGSQKTGIITTTQVTATAKTDATTQPVIAAYKKIAANVTKKVNKKTAPSSPAKPIASTKMDNAIGTNPATPTPGKQKNRSSKQPAQAAQPVAGTKGAASKPAPPAAQPVLAAKPTVTKTPATASKKVAQKGSSTGAIEPETEEENVEPVIASAPPVAKAEEKKPEVKIAATEVKKAEEPTVEKAPTVDSTKDAEPDAIRRFMAGIKGGYESGLSKVTANKFVASPYFQYNIGGKFSLLVQPSLKASHLKKRIIGGTSSYYDVNTGSGKYTLLDSALLIIPTTPSTFDTYWVRNYAYFETHDSIAKSYSIGGTYLEVGLPLLLQYNITPKLSVYGGVNSVYSRLISVKENSFVAREIQASGNPSTTARLNAPAPTPTETDITYSGNPYSGYNGPLIPETKGSNFRFGYMLGFSYEIKKRWMADVLVQQTFVKQNIQAGYNINNALSMPYMRFTIGYRLTK